MRCLLWHVGMTEEQRSHQAFVSASLGWRGSRVCLPAIRSARGQIMFVGSSTVTQPRSRHVTTTSRLWCTSTTRSTGSCCASRSEGLADHAGRVCRLHDDCQSASSTRTQPTTCPRCTAPTTAPVEGRTMTTGFIWHERLMWHMTGPASGTYRVAGDFEPGLQPRERRDQAQVQEPARRLRGHTAALPDRLRTGDRRGPFCGFTRPTTSLESAHRAGGQDNIIVVLIEAEKAA